ncbi:hypothetical protein MTQ01_07330 [Streptomyces sp. XM4193]|uniref:hypothetical protein n=1 Tax=Streptomyces sp. XM4193 TaxID=2929782 RepID=UPI001FF9810E|nr:hypothetical protein [Streptomyces sp. XM4193]MCK1795819.1 hypothetical protein [Streptomyces sp. XM4193]
MNAVNTGAVAGGFPVKPAAGSGEGSAGRRSAGAEGEFTETFSDAELLSQPMGYWSGAASAAIVARINGAVGRFGLAQRNWWVLYRAGAEGAVERGGLTREEIVRVIAESRPFLDDAVLGPAVDEVVAAGLLEEVEGRLVPTARGGELRTKLMDEVVPATLAEARAGVSDEEYVLTLRVLRRMIANTGGDTSFTP